MAGRGDQTARDVAEAVARRSYGKLVAFLAARTKDVAGAEDALSDAFAAALRDWPEHGSPVNPEAWLMAVARRRMIDSARRQRRGAAAVDHLRLIADEIEADAAAGTEIPDHRLGLMFACAHPAIESTLRAPLILQTVLGFDAAAIASAFLISPTAMGQRLVRAKAKIRQAGIPFRVPGRADLSARLESVLDAIYATYAEGWSDPAGADIRRRSMSEEGIWLGRLVVSLLPDEPEALGLLAMMLHAEARRLSRRDSAGDYVPLAEQDTRLWDDDLIDEAEALLFRASAKGITGRFQLEAAVQSAHARRRHGGQSDWAAIVRIYDALSTISHSLVVAINRAIALAQTEGSAAGLNALDALSDDPRLRDYQPYWAARAHLIADCRGIEAADEAYQRAIGLESDPAVRRFLMRRQSGLKGGN
jgi:RNA polymerase sigma-70 factor (ECF subfamily)